MIKKLCLKSDVDSPIRNELMSLKLEIHSDIEKSPKHKLDKENT